MDRQRHKRIVVETPPRRSPRGSGRQAAPRPRESIVAVTVIAAATLATFLALFVTSRPYDPMDSTVAPQQTVPQSPGTPTPSPKPSPTGTPLDQEPSSGQTPESAPEPKASPINAPTIHTK